MDDRFPVVDVSKLKMPKIPIGTAGVVLGLIVVLVTVFSTVYQIGAEEVGVVLRFGKYNPPDRQPGLRFKLPFIDDVTLVPVQRQLKHEFGFRTVQAGVRTEFATQERRFADEAVMLTGDLNVAVVEWIVQYRVVDPYQYLFKVRNLDETFRAMNEAVMRETVGDRTVTEVVTVGRQEVENAVQIRLQALTDQYQMGITIDQVVLQDVNPPDPVRPSWDDVSQAQQQAQRLVNEAEAEYNAIIPGPVGRRSRRSCKPRGTRWTA